MRTIGSSSHFVTTPRAQKIEKVGAKDFDSADKLMKNIKLDASIFGKPNCIVNKQGIEIGKYVNTSLNQFSAKELIELSEKFSLINKSLLMKRIFEQIEREKNENEYNRTEV